MGEGRQAIPCRSCSAGRRWCVTLTAQQRTEGQEIVVTAGQDWLQPRTMNARNWEPEGSIVRQLAEERQNER